MWWSRDRLWVPEETKKGRPAGQVVLIDTPGVHRPDSSLGRKMMSEVREALEGCNLILLLVDAFEGPRPQTRYVLKKALEVGLKPIVVINKIDRPDARPQEALSETFDLFVELGADDATLDFPYIFASGRAGYATHDPNQIGDSITPLLDLILDGLQLPHRFMGAFIALIKRGAQAIQPGFPVVGRVEKGRADFADAQSEIFLYLFPGRVRLAGQPLDKLLPCGFDGTLDLLMPAIGGSGTIRINLRLPIRLRRAEGRSGLVLQMARSACNFRNAGARHRAQRRVKFR